jgi:hypothetical protein
MWPDAGRADAAAVCAGYKLSFAEAQRPQLQRSALFLFALAHEFTRHCKRIGEIEHQGFFRADHLAEQGGLSFILDVADGERSDALDSGLPKHPARVEQLDTFDACGRDSVDVRDHGRSAGFLEML